MCMWFGFNPAVNFCHFCNLLTLSFFAGTTSTSPKFDLYFYINISFESFSAKRFDVSVVGRRRSSHFLTEDVDISA